MRCYCCNKILSTRESTRKFAESQTFVDMCDTCVGFLDDEISIKETNEHVEAEFTSEDVDGETNYGN